MVHYNYSDIKHIQHTVESQNVAIEPCSPVLSVDDENDDYCTQCHQYRCNYDDWDRDGNRLIGSQPRGCVCRERVHRSI